MDRSPGTIFPPALLATALIGLFVIAGFTSINEGPVADIRIEPELQNVRAGETFEVEVVVESAVPVNVFAGELRFDPSLLVVDSIDYNISIADLWAELPWFSNGDGTLNFAGGSTHAGGFEGTGSLIKVRFKSLREGEGVISIHGTRILKHDGLGTDAELARPADAVFTIEQEDKNLISRSPTGTTYRIAREVPSTDVNGDGKQSIADVSIFMLHLAGSNSRYDFNVDGRVDLKDLNILLTAK